MEWSRVAADWQQFAGEIKRRWRKLPHEEVLACAGERAPLECKLAEHYGMTREQAQREVDNWLNLPGG